MSYTKTPSNEYEAFNYQNIGSADIFKPCISIQKEVFGKRISVSVTNCEDKFSKTFAKSKLSNPLTNRSSRKSKSDNGNVKKTVGVKTNTVKSTSNKKEVSNVISSNTKCIGIKNSSNNQSKAKNINIESQKSNKNSNIVIQVKTEAIGIKTNKKSSEKEKYDVAKLNKYNDKTNIPNLEVNEFTKPQLDEVALDKQNDKKSKVASGKVSNVKKIFKKVVEKPIEIDNKNSISTDLKLSIYANSLESPAKEFSNKSNFKSYDCESKISNSNTLKQTTNESTNKSTLTNAVLLEKYIKLNNELKNSNSNLDFMYKECASTAEKFEYNIVYSKKSSDCSNKKSNMKGSCGKLTNFDKYKEINVSSNISTDENDKYLKYKNNDFCIKKVENAKPSENIVDNKRNMSLGKTYNYKSSSKKNIESIENVSKKDKLDIMFGKEVNKKIKTVNSVNSQNVNSDDSFEIKNSNGKLNVNNNQLNGGDKLSKDNVIDLFNNNLVLKNSVFNSDKTNVSQLNSKFDVYKSLHGEVDNVRQFKYSPSNHILNEVALDYSYDMKYTNDVILNYQCTNKNTKVKSGLFTKKTLDNDCKVTHDNKVGFITNIKNKIEKAIKFISSIFKSNKNS